MSDDNTDQNITETISESNLRYVRDMKRQSAVSAKRRYIIGLCEPFVSVDYPFDLTDDLLAFVSTLIDIPHTVDNLEDEARDKCKAYEDAKHKHEEFCNRIRRNV